MVMKSGPFRTESRYFITKARCLRSYQLIFVMPDNDLRSRHLVLAIQSRVGARAPTSPEYERWFADRKKWRALASVRTSETHGSHAHHRQTRAPLACRHSANSTQPPRWAARLGHVRRTSRGARGERSNACAQRAPVKSASDARAPRQLRAVSGATAGWK